MVIKYYNLLDSIVNDRDQAIMVNFRLSLYDFLKIKQKFLIAYHLQ